MKLAIEIQEKDKSGKEDESPCYSDTKSVSSLSKELFATKIEF